MGSAGVPLAGRSGLVGRLPPGCTTGHRQRQRSLVAGWLPDAAHLQTTCALHSCKRAAKDLLTASRHTHKKPSSWPSTLCSPSHCQSTPTCTEARLSSRLGGPTRAATFWVRNCPVFLRPVPYAVKLKARETLPGSLYSNILPLPCRRQVCLHVIQYICFQPVVDSFLST